MLDRNKRVKPRPERFQSCKDPFDLILTCEERVYDQVVEGRCCASTGRGGHPLRWAPKSQSHPMLPDLNSREQETCQPVHVVNVDIQDNHEEATLGAFLLCELCQCVGAGPRVGGCHPRAGGCCPMRVGAGLRAGGCCPVWVGAGAPCGWVALSRLSSMGAGPPLSPTSLQIQHTEDMENELEELLQEFEEKSGRAFLHTVCFY